MPHGRDRLSRADFNDGQPLHLGEPLLQVGFPLAETMIEPTGVSKHQNIWSRDTATPLAAGRVVRQTATNIVHFRLKVFGRPDVAHAAVQALQMME